LAVTGYCGLGFLASGYLSAAELAGRRRRADELTGRPFGVNVFVPGPAGDVARVGQFAAEIESDVSGAGARMGEPRHDDDDWDAKVGYLMDTPADVVSFTFGIPGEDVISGLRARGTEVWVTVTSPQEARRAAAAGADLLVVQGYEAGGHRGGTSDAPEEAVGLIALLQLITARMDTPDRARDRERPPARSFGICPGGLPRGASPHLADAEGRPPGRPRRLREPVGRAGLPADVRGSRGGPRP
jgi:nitronate monooxygenase